MPLRSAKQYVESLRDGRTVYFRGERVVDVTTHPVMEKAVALGRLDFEMAEDPAHRDLAVVRDKDLIFSRYYKLPAGPEDLVLRSRLIEEGTAIGKTFVILIKEIGTDALFALHRVAPLVDKKYGTTYLERVKAYHARCRDGDLALAVAQTDVKGDRSQGPIAQEHPDYYVRIVERRKDGIVVRGAKMHTTSSTNANEIIVLPARAMTDKDGDYAVSFAVPVATPGVKLVTSAFNSSPRKTFDAPLSADRKLTETVTIFDDVFVPNERVFLCGEWDFAGPLALSFVEYHRFTAVSYKLPLVDALVGSAALLADLNGIAKAGHVRDKLVWLISYAETVRAVTEMAALRGRADSQGIFAPDPLTTNIAKSHFAHNYHQALQHVQDVAGGMLVTAPSSEDFENQETGPLLRKYLGGRPGVDGETRVRAMNMVSDLTTGELGGYHAVLAVHAEGSLEAEKMMIARAYDMRRALAYAKKLAGIG